MRENDTRVRDGSEGVVGLIMGVKVDPSAPQACVLLLRVDDTT